ncbi:uncharacterized protein OCT59_006334 [Rhizophagus irregularis]|uniref:uncharacterized protein n=1 Tax=Rhizophagus irregularis TaxID=588596 RepID=UPI00331CB56A|nr:hypothetical protein OCT59_006334 [Rhizophagus irregularis]
MVKLEELGWIEYQLSIIACQLSTELNGPISMKISAGKTQTPIIENNCESSIRNTKFPVVGQEKRFSSYVVLQDIQQHD